MNFTNWLRTVLICLIRFNSLFKNHSLSGPFWICFNRMLISTASMVEKRIRKRKNVRATLPEFRSLTAAHVGSMS